jgi:hypothetical protein
VQFYSLVDIGFIARLTSASNLCDTRQRWGNRISYSNQRWAVPGASNINVNHRTESPLVQEDAGILHAPSMRCKERHCFFTTICGVET